MKIEVVIGFCITFFVGFSQPEPSYSHQVLVQLHQPISKKKTNNTVQNALKWECIAPELNIWKVSSSQPISNDLILKMYQWPEVITIQRNTSKRIVARNRPNDTYLNNQFHHFYNILSNSTYKGINTLDAWQYGYGGITKKGDTIAIAIIDEGLSPDLEDIDYYINHGEIPNDRIDNDGNGAIDDYIGWDAEFNRALTNYNGDHGNKAMGIAAAKINNFIGVAGISNAKVIPIIGFGTEENIVKAYNYVLKLKKEYLYTNGKRGAYIVATNTSGGVSNAFEKDHPIWCSIYDSLAKYGILNVSATDNLNINVDSLGDIPTLCSSPYLITTTHIAENNNSIHSFGPKNVDIAAYGTSHFSTLNGNIYAKIGNAGTSFASPQVAGAIALMYSHFSASFLDSIHANPQNALLLIKKRILENVDTVPILKNKIVSHGKLNLAKIINSLVKNPDLIQSRSSSLYPNEIALEYSSNGVVIYNPNLEKNLVFSLYNIGGQRVFSQPIAPAPSEQLAMPQLSNALFIGILEKEGTPLKTIKIIHINDHY